MGLLVQEKKLTLILPTKFQLEKKLKNDIQDGHHLGGHLGFPIRMILAFFFYLQVYLILPTKFRDRWPFGSGEKVQNRF